MSLSRATPTTTGMESSPGTRDCSRRITIWRWPSTICMGIARGGPSKPPWAKPSSAGQMIDRVTAKLGRKLYEVPVGFKWFVDGLLHGSLGFAGEESAGACCLRLDGKVWTTDKY